MALYNDAWMETLLSRNDIANVVGSYVALRPKGGRLWGLCPFHTEKTPSFSVVPDKQFYYCFGCHKGGGVVQFVMEMERLSYGEAVRFLAERANLEMPGNVDDEALKRQRMRKERLYAICKEAALYYHKQLLSDLGAPARAYLGRRGLDAKTVTHFGLGYALDGWDNILLHMTEKGFSREELVESGLLVKNSKSGRVYDAYRNRVIFPIIGANGRVLGFGARAMGEETPKYINTGDTPIYNKRNHLYALNMQKGAGKPQDIIMVEGYMDVIGLYQRGIKNVVASLGTALTQQQARLLKKYVSTVYIAYDGDAAGQNATLRGLDILSKEGLSVRVIVVPGGQDPDEFVREHGKEAFDALRDSAMALSTFKLSRMVKDYDLHDPDAREAYAREACKFIATLEPVERERHYLIVARETGISVAALQDQGSREGKAAANASLRQNAGRTQRLEERMRMEYRDLELQMLWGALHDKEAAALIPEGFEFANPAHGAIFAQITRTYMAGKPPDGPLLIAALDPEATKEAAKLLNKEPPVDAVKTVADCLKSRERGQLLAKAAALRERMTGDTVPLDEKLALVKEVQELEARVRDLTK